MDNHLRPLTVLGGSLNKNVLVKVKWNREYRGVLDGYDQHMNLVIKNAEEVISDKSNGVFPTVVVRGDVVVYISPSEVI
ncbi:MAG: small nuclear ribonucleoprotein [Candidatus Thermoplasmatota archaeon]|jgi:small nuclear ribonucleoprotein|nr:small nuclear ribonucleoprotein [Candidatus Thermoplasmatota archaeon]